ncbi:MAG TPA: DoxX family protein [Actinomycetota bacterium]|nr:DoxX family protein [Actinomycetota bacterium]
MSDAAGIVFLVGRVVFALPFLTTSMFHLRQGAQAEGYAKSVGFPFPGLAGWPAGLWLVAGAGSIALGVWPDLGSLMIALWAIPTILWFHPYWKMEGEQRMTQQLLFRRNVMFLGAALALFAVFASLGPQAPFTLVDPLFRF